MRGRAILVAALVLAGCGGSLTLAPDRPLAGDVSGQVRPQARPAGLDTAARRPPPGARTPEDFDTTTVEERAAAAAPPAPAGEQALGETVASLGDPSRPGFWLETPLVEAPARGRVEFAGTGETAQVDLIPTGGTPGSGSRISLAAMRLLGVPLTDLPTLRVFRAP